MTKALRTPLPDADPESESGGLEWGDEARGARSMGRSLSRRTRHLLQGGALLGCLVAFLALGSGTHAPRLFQWAHPDGRLELESVEASDPCGAFPFFKIEKLLHSNLGGKGPDSGAEGIMYSVTTTHTGLHLHGKPLELHMHAVGDYHPSWPKENGFHKHFGRVNLKAGTNVSLEVHALNPETNDTVVLPKGSVTFFDIDSGKQAVEFITSSGFTDVVLTNETEVETVDNADGSTTFKATARGDGDDNPENPLEMGVLQKNRAVTLMYEKVEKLNFVLGCTEGEETRVFTFVIRPALLCANTKLDDGSVVSAAKSPIRAVHHLTDGAGGEPVTVDDTNPAEDAENGTATGGPEAQNKHSGSWRPGVASLWLSCGLFGLAVAF